MSRQLSDRELRIIGAQKAENARIAEVKSLGTRPAQASSEINACAPALGAVTLFRHETVIRTADGNLRYQKTTPSDATALRRGDAFDLMQDQANRRARARSLDAPQLFTRAQIEAGRTYGHLVERHACRGVKGLSLETSSPSSRGGSYMDAVVAEGRRLDRMRAAMDGVWAIEPKRAAPHADLRRAVRMQVLVDHVCVEGLTLSQVLARYGWSAGVKNLAPFRDAFRAGLDLLYGL